MGRGGGKGEGEGGKILPCKLTVCCGRVGRMASNGNIDRGVGHVRIVWSSI